MNIWLDNFKSVLRDNGAVADQQIVFDDKKGQLVSRENRELVARKYGFEMERSVQERQQNVSARMLLLNALSQSFGVNDGDESVRAFMAKAERTLLGKPDGGYGKNEDDDCYKPLMARDVRALIDEGESVLLQAVMRAFVKEVGNGKWPAIDFLSAKRAVVVSFRDGKKGSPEQQQEAAGLLKDFTDRSKDFWDRIRRDGVSDIRSAVNEFKEIHRQFLGGAGRLQAKFLCERLLEEVGGCLEGFMSRMEKFAPENCQDLVVAVAKQLEKGKTKDIEQLVLRLDGMSVNENPDDVELKKLCEVEGLEKTAEETLAALKAAVSDRERVLGNILALGVGKQLDRLAGAFAYVRDLCNQSKAGSGDDDRAKALERFVKRLDELEGQTRGRILEIGTISPDSLRKAVIRVQDFGRAFAATLKKASSGNSDYFARMVDETTLPHLLLLSEEDQEAARGQAQPKAGVRLAGAGKRQEVSERESTVCSHLDAFTGAVEELMTVAGGLKPQQRAEFNQLAESVADEVGKAVSEALAAGVDLDLGVAALLKGKLQYLQTALDGALKPTMLETLEQPLDDAVRQLEAKIVEVGPKNPNTQAALRREKEAIVEFVKTIVPNRLADLMRQGIVPNPADVQKLAGELKTCVDTFVTQVFAAKAKLIGANKALQQMSAVVPEFKNTGKASDFLQGVTDGRFRDIDALRAETLSAQKFNYRFGAAVKTLESDGSLLNGMIQNALVLQCGDLDTKIFDIDRKSDNIRGYTTKGGEIAKNLKAELTAFVKGKLKEFETGEPMSEQQILDRLKDVLDRKLNDSVKLAMEGLADDAEPEAPQNAPQAKHPYPAGSGAFGLDVAKLNEDQKAGFANLVRTVVHESVRKGFDRYFECSRALKEAKLFSDEGLTPAESVAELKRVLTSLAGQRNELFKDFDVANNMVDGQKVPQDRFKGKHSPEFEEYLREKGFAGCGLALNEVAIREIDVIDAYLEGKGIDSPSNELVIGALNAGLKLEGLSEQYAAVLIKVLRDAKTSKPSDLSLKNNFGVYDAQSAIAALKDVGLTPESMAGLPRMSWTACNKISEVLNFLYGLNYKSLTGARDVCLRYFGVPFIELVGVIVTASEKGWNPDAPNLPPAQAVWARFEKDSVLASAQRAEENAQRTIRANVEARKNGGDEFYVKDWREQYDPILTAAEDEKRAVRFLMRQLQPSLGPKGTVDKDTCLGEIAFRTVLRDLPAGAETDVTVFGVPVKLLVDGDGRISAKVRILPPAGEQKARGGEPRWINVSVPVDRTAFIGQIDDAVVQNVGTYGVGAARTLLQEAVGKDAGSSRVRQLSMDIICSYAGLRTADLCYDSTATLSALALDLLDGKASPATAAGRKAYAKAVVGQQPGGAKKLVLLNSAGTLETYRRMQDKLKDPGFKLTDKVEVPEPVRYRKGEKRHEAWIRQVHDFAADLVQIADSTKFDLDRQAGKSDADILRETLVRHRMELRTLILNPDLLKTFDIPGVANGPALTTFRVKLENGIARLKEFLSEKGNDFNAFIGFLNTSDDRRLTEFLAEFRTDLTETSTQVLEVMQKSFKDKLVEAFEKGMTSVGKPVWQKSLDELAGGGGLDVNTGYGKFLMQVIGSYFAEMDPIDRNRMAAQVIRLSTSESTLGETLGALLKGAGPILQKLMQGLPQTSLPDELRAAVADLKSRLPPIPEDAVRAYLLDMVESSGGRIDKIIVRKSLGAATVGQAFLCTMVTKEHPEGEECVVKILRPDVQSRALREENFFNRKAVEMGLGDTLKNRFERIFDELDLVVEASNVLGGGIYDPGTVTYKQSGVYSSPDVHSMKLNPLVNPTMNTMVLVKAPGTTLDDYIESVSENRKAILAPLKASRRPDGTVRYMAGNVIDYLGARYQLSDLYGKTLRRQKYLSNFISKWSFEAVFGSGFFHGDVHAGNLMVSEDGLTAIDYGNATRLTEQERTNIMWMMARVGVNSVSGFLDHFKSAMSEETRKDLDAVINTARVDLAKIFDKGGKDDSGRKFVAAVQYLQGKGVPIPGALFNLMQSMQRLDESVRLLNEQLEDIRQAMDGMGLEPAEGDGISWIAKSATDEVLKAGDLEATLQSRKALRSAVGPFATRDVIRNESLSGFEEEALRRIEGGKREDRLKLLDDMEAFVKVVAERFPGDQVLSSLVGIQQDELAKLRKRIESEDDLAGNDPTRDPVAKHVHSFVAGFLPMIFDTSAINAAYAELEAPQSFADALGTAISDGLDTISTAEAIFGDGPAVQRAVGAVKSAEAKRRVQKARANELLDAFAKARETDVAATKVFPREIAIAKDMGASVLVPDGFDKTLASVKWSVPGNPARKLVLDVLEVNLKEFREHMRKAGLGDRLAKPDVVKAYAEMEAIRLFTFMPEWADRLAKLSPADKAAAKQDPRFREPGMAELFDRLCDLAAHPPKAKAN